MLSVIVVPGKPEKLPGLLAMLVAGVVENVVREVVVVEQGDPQLLDALCDATGAARAPDLAQAVSRARHDWLMVAPPELRLRDGWVERFADFLREGGGEARIEGVSEGFLKPGARGVILSSAKAERAGSAQGGLQGLARELGRGARRLG